MIYIPTSRIIQGSQYKNSPTEFFAMFSDAWTATRCQVVKLETRQIYQEPDNESYQLLIAGDEKGAIAALKQSRSSDDSLYEMLRQNNVDFVRCRPIKFPISTYLKWALHAYEHNSRLGERIFWCNEIALHEFFIEKAQHDFMVFDSRIAFIHDYDPSGLIQGGWLITESNKINELLSLFSFIKANCQAFQTLQLPE